LLLADRQRSGQVGALWLERGSAGWELQWKAPVVESPHPLVCGLRYCVAVGGLIVGMSAYWVPP
jgi:hypothetical protein